MDVHDGVAATKTVPTTQDVSASKKGVLPLGALSSSAAKTGAAINVARPCTLSRPEIVICVSAGSRPRRTSSMYGRIGTTKPYSRVSERRTC